MPDETHGGRCAIGEDQVEAIPGSAPAETTAAAGPASAEEDEDGFEANLATYQALLPGLVDREGQYIVLHDGVIAGFFNDFQDAVTVGYDKFGLAAFLVKQVRQIEPVIYL